MVYVIADSHVSIEIVVILVVEHQWMSDHPVAHPQTKTIATNLIWSESDQWLLRYSVRKVWGLL